MTETTLDAKIAVALGHIARAQRAIHQQQASRVGITPLQLSILALLGTDPPPEHFTGALADELGLRQPTVTDAIAALESKGLVSRTRDPDDQRRTTLALTADGRRTLDDIDTTSPLEAAIETADDSQKSRVFATLVEIVAELNRSGELAAARTCPTCSHYAPPATDGAPPHCRLLRVDLTPGRLQIDCPDHMLQTTPT